MMAASAIAKKAQPKRTTTTTTIQSLLIQVGKAVHAPPAGSDASLSRRMLRLYEYTTLHPSERITLATSGEQLSPAHFVVRAASIDPWYLDRSQWLLQSIASSTVTEHMSHAEQRQLLCDALRSENAAAVSMLVTYFEIHLGKRALFDALARSCNALVLDEFLRACIERDDAVASAYAIRPDLTDDRGCTPLHLWALQWQHKKRLFFFYFPGIIESVVNGLVMLGVPPRAKDAAGHTAADYLRGIREVARDTDAFVYPSDSDSGVGSISMTTDAAAAAYFLDVVLDVDDAPASGVYT